MDTCTLAFESVAELAIRLRKGSINSTSLVEQLLDRIGKLDAQLHSFVAVMPERALAAARAADITLKAGQDLGPLHGIPYAAKDLFDVRDMPTTAGTRLRKSHRAAADSTPVEKLTAAGMALLGKTYTVQFALGVVGINHDQGTPLNPWSSVPCAPGGSSSGSAVAVAAGLTPMALGTDTGGSVRVPAALCGIVGLKTTVGRISRAGVYPLSWTLDSVGVLARSVQDAALVYQVLQGEDEDDPSTQSIATPSSGRDPHLQSNVRNLRLAFAETIFFDNLDTEVETAVRNAGHEFRTLGAHLESIAIPEIAEAQVDRARLLLISAEACAINSDYLDQHFDSLDPVVARRMIQGRSLLATDYVALLHRRAELQRRIQQTLQDVDALLVPTTMIPAAPLSIIDQTLDTYVAYNSQYNRNAMLGNYFNWCAVSLPCGFTQDGLPIGLMIYCKPFHEHVALRVAHAYEQATEWHLRRPNLAWAEEPSFIESHEKIPRN